MEQVRIVSNGTPLGTKVYDAEGKEIKGISVVEWRTDAHMDLSEAYVTFRGVKLEATGIQKGGILK